MACPYFMPLTRLDSGNWQHPARLPLGCGWSGHCTAPGHEAQVPQQNVIESLCNLGYAGRCEWAPRERAWDAVRFAVKTPIRQENADGEFRSGASTIRLAFVCERDHRPVKHGDLEYDLKDSLWLRRHDDARVQQMAECFLDAYLRKRSTQPYEESV